MLRRFDAHRDYNTLCKWYASWNMTPPPANTLPAVGFVIDECVMSFLYQCEGQMGLWEGTISDPECTKEQREAAYGPVLEAVEKAAKEMGISHIVCLTRNKSVLSHLGNMGFSVSLPLHELVKEIR